jgi:hypothetical protein
MRPESDSPSTVVRSHDDRRASTSSESADGFVVVFATGVGSGAGAGEGVVGVVAAVETGPGFDDALAGAVDCAALSVVAGFLSDRIHTIVPTRTAIPATPNNPTNIRARRDEGTGTASLGNGEDSNVRGAVVDIAGGCNGDVDDIAGGCNGDIDDIEGEYGDVDDIDDAEACEVAGVSEDAGPCGGTAVIVFGATNVFGSTTSVSSENTLGSSGGGGSFGGSANA